MKKIIIITLILIMGNNAFAMEKKGFPIAPQPLINAGLDQKFVSAVTFESLIKTVNNIKNNSEALIDGFQKATSRYTQTNVVAAYKDFSMVINSIKDKNDFLYMTLAQRLDNFGFFSLSQNAIINIKDIELWNKQINSLKNYYRPVVTLTYDEEIYLAKLQTDTLYNNSAKETIKILSKDDKILKKSDYANYILAVAYYENENYQKALNAINKALNKAPDRINYIHFKEKILSQSGNYKAALKIIEEMEKVNIISKFEKESLTNDKLFILMKMSKKDKAKYYSAKLLFQTGEYQKALKEAQSAVSLNKKNIDAYVLIADCYLKNNDYEKAKEFYSKAYDLKKKSPAALLGLGHYYYSISDYEKAILYYEKAYKYDSRNEQIMLCLANTLLMNNENERALFYLNKILKENQNSDGAYYLFSKLVPNMKEQYLRTALSINPVNVNAWLDLAELKIVQKKYDEAKEYLFPVKIISPINSRYIFLDRQLKTNNHKNLKSLLDKNFEKESFLNLIF